MLGALLYSNPDFYSGSWNFGPFTHEPSTVQSVAEMTIKHIGKGRIEIVEVTEKVHEANLLQLNCDKSNHLLGWYPRWNNEISLKATALWYKKVLN